MSTVNYKLLFGIGISVLPLLTLARTPPLPVPVDSAAVIIPHQHRAATFTDQTINHVLWPIVNKFTAFPDIPAWYANAERPPFPQPPNDNYLKNHITMRDAIWIALRNSPTVKNAEAQRIEDKFALEVAQHVFVPQFTDNFTYSRNMETRIDTLSTMGGVQLTTPFATTLSSDFTNTTKAYFDHRNTYTANITQPLLNGGWLTPWYTYLDAVSAEQQAKLTFRSSIITVVTGVISDYTALVSAYNQLNLDRRQYQETLEELRQSKLEVKYGRMSVSSYTQEAAALATNKLGVVQDENSLQQTYETLLTDLGLVATVPLKIDRQIRLDGFSVPSMKTCIRVALRFNPAYLGDKLTIGNDKRALITAINGLLPTFNATADFTYGNGQRTIPTVGFTASVPIDDIEARQTELNAKIQLEQDKIALATERQSIISTITTDWNTIQSNLAQIAIGKKQVALQQQVVKDDRLALKYGRMTMFEYQQDRATLLSYQQGLVDDKINYIQSVSTIDQDMGITLKRWNIKLHY